MNTSKDRETIIIMLAFTFLMFTFPCSGLQSSSIACQQTLSVCGFMLGRQDNWLITQHISRIIGGTETQLPQVSVLLEFQLVGCDINGCQRTLIHNVWETSPAD